MSTNSPIASSSRVTLDDPVVTSHDLEFADSIQIPNPLTDNTIDILPADHEPSPTQRVVSAPVAPAPSSRSSSPSRKGKEREEATPDDGSLTEIHDGPDQDEEDGDEFHAYERERQRRIQENQLLLNSLGIASIAQPLTPTTSLPRTSSQNQLGSKRRSKKLQGPVYDRSGFIISLPGPGERHRMACVEMPSDRAVRRRIVQGEYQDCTDWKYGEDRRWRFGGGEGGELADDEIVTEGGVGKDFRWRKWRGLEKELRKEMKRRGELNARDINPQRPILEDGVNPYSILPGDACHQCKRKSEKEKMRCRNVNPVCRALFCETCCKRYSYFDFDPEARSWICPLCKDCCNCANCIRKRNLAHLLDGKNGIRSEKVRKAGKDGMTVQAWLEQALEDKTAVPFDRVRLVDQALDVISPDLPEEPSLIEEKKKKRGRKPRDEGRPKAKRGRPKKESQMTQIDSGLVIKLKLPKSQPQRVKEVDSDGDTVGGYSDNESNASSKLTSLDESPAASPVIPGRFAFPPRLSGQPVQEQSPKDDLVAITARIKSPELHRISTVISPATAHDLPASESPLPVTLQPTPPPSISPSKVAVEPPPNGSGKEIRRRKPPPKANIVRAPKHAPLSPNPPPSEPSTATTWQQTPVQLSTFQTFSYEGYSNIPPATILPQAMPQHFLDPQPPPYSHSPAFRPTLLENTTSYLSLPPQNLDLLSLAAAEARHSPSVDEYRNQHFVPTYTNPNYLGTILPPGNLWSGGPNSADLTQEMMGSRRYHPDYP